MRSRNGREYMKRRRVEAKAAGLCVRCLVAPAAPGLTHCRPCRDSTNKDRMTRRFMNVALGRCKDCGREKRPGMLLCEDCQKFHTRCTVRYKRNLRPRGICRECIRPMPEVGPSYCAVCSAMFREREALERAVRHG